MFGSHNIDSNIRAGHRVVLPDLGDIIGDTHSTGVPNNVGQGTIEVYDKENSTPGYPIFSEEYLKAIRYTVFNRRENMEMEFYRLFHILDFLCHGSCSRANSIQILKSKCVSSRYFYWQILNYLQSRCCLQNFWARMCPVGHMAAMDRYSDQEDCEFCVTEMTANKTFQYVKLSSIIAALCMEKISFQQLLDGCRQSVRAARNESDPNNLLDFYDGPLFKLTNEKCFLILVIEKSYMFLYHFLQMPLIYSLIWLHDEIHGR